MKRVLIAAALLFAALPVFAALDLTGKWTGTFQEVGSTDGGEVIYLDLKQSGTELTGVAGPDATTNWPIMNGKVNGDKVTFTVQMKRDQQLGPTISFALSAAGDHLKGDMNAEFNGEKKHAILDAQREKK